MGFHIVHVRFSQHDLSFQKTIETRKLNDGNFVLAKTFVGSFYFVSHHRMLTVTSPFAHGRQPSKHVKLKETRQKLCLNLVRSECLESICELCIYLWMFLTVPFCCFCFFTEQKRAKRLGFLGKFKVSASRLTCVCQRLQVCLLLGSSCKS